MTPARPVCSGRWASSWSEPVRLDDAPGCQARVWTRLWHPEVARLRRRLGVRATSFDGVHRRRGWRSGRSKAFGPSLGLLGDDGIDLEDEPPARGRSTLGWLQPIERDLVLDLHGGPRHGGPLLAEGEDLAQAREQQRQA